MLPSPGLHLSARQTDLLEGGVALFSSISLISSLIIVFTHWYFKDLRKKSLKLVAFMSVALAGADLTALIFITGGSCGWYTFLTNFFVIAAALWSAVLSRTVSLVLNRDGLSSRLTRLDSIARGRGRCLRWLRNNADGVRMFVFHILVWGISFLCAVAMDIDTDEEPSLSNWCWFSPEGPVQTDDDNNVDNVGSSPNPAQLALFFTPIGFAMLYNAKTLFWHSFREYFLQCRVCAGKGSEEEAFFREQVQIETNENELQREITLLCNRLKYYIFLSFFVCSWLVISELVNIFDTSRGSIIYSYSILLITFPLHGFGNLVIYLWRDDVRSAWWKEIYSLLGMNYTPSESSDDKTGTGPSDVSSIGDGNTLKNSLLENDHSYNSYYSASDGCNNSASTTPFAHALTAGAGNGTRYNSDGGGDDDHYTANDVGSEGQQSSNKSAAAADASLGAVAREETGGRNRSSSAGNRSFNYYSNNSCNSANMNDLSDIGDGRDDRESSGESIRSTIVSSHSHYSSRHTSQSSNPSAGHSGLRISNDMMDLTINVSIDDVDLDSSADVTPRTANIV